MAQNSSQAAESGIVEAASGKRPRLYFIDHLRAALVILVVLHHLALVYGGIPPFYYFEPPLNDPLAGVLALLFVLFNQAWFMGAFFLLAGYFTPGSYERKGAGAFLRDRLIRLGIPILLFIFVLNPLSSTGYWLMPTSLIGISDPLTWQTYPFLLGLGPLWFVAMLLVFSFGYAAWRMLTGKRSAPSATANSLPSTLWIAVFTLGLALAHYLMRIFVPVGQEVSLFVDFLSFPTIAYLPQYLSFFVLGIIAARPDWLRSLPRRMGALGFVAALAGTALLFPIPFLSFLSAIENAAPQYASFGYGSWQSALYALWDSVFAVGLVLGLIPFFRRYFNGQGSFGTFLAQHSYTVYIIHIPIIVFLAYALRGIQLPALLKFTLAAVIVVPICFIVAYLLRKIPFASRVL